MIYLFPEGDIKISVFRIKIKIKIVNVLLKIHYKWHLESLIKRVVMENYLKQVEMWSKGGCLEWNLRQEGLLWMWLAVFFLGWALNYYTSREMQLPIRQSDPLVCCFSGLDLAMILQVLALTSQRWVIAWNCKQNKSFIPKDAFSRGILSQLQKFN